MERYLVFLRGGMIISKIYREVKLYTCAEIYIYVFMSSIFFVDLKTDL